MPIDLLLTHGRRVAGLSLCWAVSLAAFAQDARTIHYDWLTAGEVSGSLIVQIQSDGVRTADFQFNDRGRGPKIHEKLRVGTDGSLLALEVSGHSYMGAPADERFRVADGKARWESTLEQGEAPAGAFYTGNDGTPEQLAVLARALLRADGRRLDLLPAGTASIREVATHAVSLGERALPATLYAITGLDLTPQYLWLDGDRELFALTYGWMGLAPRDRGAALEELQAIQDRAEEDYHRALARDLTQELPSNWVIRNVSVLDVEGGRLQAGRAVAVADGRILRVAKDSGADLPVAGDLEPRIVDGQGLVLMPGMWDMHTHLSLSDGLLQIAAGVTAVRDLANDPKRLAGIRAAFDSGEVIGPHSVAAGFIDGRSPYSAPTGQLAENLDQALEMVRDYADAGYRHIKIYSSIDPGWVGPIAAEAHARGLRLSGHVPSSMTARQAILAGFDEIQHINMLFLNFLAGPQDDTRTPLRFTRVAERAGSLDLDSRSVAEFIGLLRDRGVVVDSTVAIFDSMFRHRSGSLDPSYDMVADHMPPAVRRGMLGGEMDIGERNAATYARSADALLEMIARLHRAGVTLVAGTDAMPGFTLHRELELYRRAGISNADVLRIATIGAARVAGQADRAGTVEAGKRADFVLLAGNPLDDINALRRAVAVFKGDRWYDTARLYEAVGIRPFTR